MTIETTIFTLQRLNTFVEWAIVFNSPEIDQFHKSVGLNPIYFG